MEVKVDKAPSFQPVSVTLTFTTQEEINAFTDFIRAVGPVKVRRILEGKALRRLPKMPETHAHSAVIQPLSKVLSELTVKAERL